MLTRIEQWRQHNNNAFYSNYYNFLTTTLSCGSDTEILEVLKRFPVPLSTQKVLFNNHGPSLDAYESILLKSDKVTLWKELLLLGLSPMCIIPLKQLRWYPKRHPTKLIDNKTLLPSMNSDHMYGLNNKKFTVSAVTAVDTPRHMLIHLGCYTILASAAAKPSGSEVLKLLLDELLRKNNYDKALLMDELSIALNLACVHGTEMIVNELLHFGAKPSLTVTNWCSPIHAAVKTRYERAKKVQYLLEFDIDPNILCPSCNISPLYDAVRAQDPITVDLLLKHGANINIAMPVLGLPTPLFYAVYWGLIEIVEILCRDGNPNFNYTSQSGESIFDIAKQAIEFSKVFKPKHISRLPLPKATTTTCEQILILLEKYFENQDRTTQNNIYSMNNQLITFDCPINEEPYNNNNSLLSFSFTGKDIIQRPPLFKSNNTGSLQSISSLSTTATHTKIACLQSIFDNDDDSGILCLKSMTYHVVSDI